MALPPPYGHGVPQDPDDLPTAWVVHERTGVEKTPAGFWIGAAALAAVATVVTLGLAIEQGDPLPIESAVDGTVYRGLASAMGAAAARTLSAVAFGIAVFSTAAAVRALAHSALAGLFAGTLLLLDPALLVQGHLALPDMLLLAAGTGALALALADHPAAAWVLLPVMTLGALLDPVFLLWGLPLTALLFLRGHIYGAPKHLATAVTQTLFVPGALALPVHLVTRIGADAVPLCAAPSRWDALAMQATDYGGMVAVHNPAVWYAGALGLGGLLLGALLYTATRFRLARMPGRVQVRLPDRLPRLHGRSLWLGLLVVSAPLPVLWTPLFAGALALGGRQLGRDSPWFGILVHAAIIAFAAIYLIRFAPLLLGHDGGGLVTQVIPWLDVAACSL